MESGRCWRGPGGTLTFLRIGVDGANLFAARSVLMLSSPIVNEDGDVPDYAARRWQTAAVCLTGLALAQCGQDSPRTTQKPQRSTGGSRSSSTITGIAAPCVGQMVTTK